MKNLLFSLLILSTSAQALDSQPTLMRFRISSADEASMPAVSNVFEVEKRHADGFDVLVPSNQQRLLKALSHGAEILSPDISEEVTADAFYAGYRDFAAVQSTLKDLASKNPELVQIISYGKSAKGLDLFAVKISDNVEIDENEPELMITSATHGDELITVEVTVSLIEQLVNAHGKDKRLTDLVKGKEIFFVPVVNPDGFTRRMRYDGWEDPNRSYPYPGKLDNKPSPCIKGLLEFFHSRKFAGTLDLHASGEMIMYPWGYTEEPVPAPPEQIFHDLTRRMAETNNYKFGPISKVIYVAKGSSADYYYMKTKAIAVAIEIGQDKVPSANRIPEHVEEIAEPTWKFIENF